MEEAYLIIDYLPVSFKAEKEQEYVNFLWDAFESNYKQEKFQFAFLAYHMLYMSFVYFNIWQIKTNYQDDFSKALIGFGKDVEKKILIATSPFTFYGVKEKSIFRFLKLLGCDNEKIGKFAKMVDYRNDIAHSNGNIFYNSHEDIDEKVEQTLQCAEQIEQCSKPMITNCFERFLVESWNPEEREYADETDQIREALIHEQYFSKKDIEFCMQFEIKSLSENKHFREIKSLFQNFVKAYKEE